MTTVAPPSSKTSTSAVAHVVGDKGNVGRLRLVTVVLPGLVFFLVPLILWTGPFSSRMNLGGDGSLLYFEYPKQWLLHSPVHALAFGATGYNPATQYAPFTFVLLVLKTLHLNPEGVILGLVLAFGYSGTAALTTRIVRCDPLPAHLAGAVAGTVMVCAPMLATQQWTSILPELFWIGLLPILLLLYLQHQRTGRLRSAVAAGLLLVVFAPAITDAPGFLPVAMVSVVLATVLAVSGVYTFVPLRLAAFLAVFFGLSFFWLGPFLLAGPFLQQPGMAISSSHAFKATSAQLATILVKQSSLADAIGLRGSFRMAVDNAWSQLAPMRWSQKLPELGLLPLLLIAASFVWAAPRRGHLKEIRLHILLSVAALVTLYMVTLRGVPGGAGLYAALVRQVPGWDILRNFYVVWSTPFVFLMALATGAWASRLFAVAPPRRASIVAGIFAIAFVVYGAPFLGGNYFRLESSTLGGSRVIPGFPPAYISVLDRIRKLPPGSVLTVPLRATSWTYIPVYKGSSVTGSYLGLSPIFFLSGRSDYNGVDSFQTPRDNALGLALSNDVQNVQLPAIASTSGAVGIRYIFVDSSEFQYPEEMRPFVVPASQAVSEWKAFMDNYAPRVLFQIGTYSVHELSAAYQTPLASSIAPSEPAASPSYPLSVAEGLTPGQNPATIACSESHVQILSWKAQSASVILTHPRPGCLLRVSVPPAPGWSATFTAPRQNIAPTSVSSDSYNDSGVNFPIPTFAGSQRTVRVDFVYRPAILLPLSAGVSLVVLLGIVAALFLRPLLRPGTRDRPPTPISEQADGANQEATRP